MTITRQDIINAYNSIYSANNNNILKTYEQLDEDEVLQSLLILLNNNGENTSGGGGGATQVQIQTAIESAVNLENIENYLNSLSTNSANYEDFQRYTLNRNNGAILNISTQSVTNLLIGVKIPSVFVDSTFGFRSQVGNTGNFTESLFLTNLGSREKLHGIQDLNTNPDFSIGNYVFWELNITSINIIQAYFISGNTGNPPIEIIIFTLKKTAGQIINESLVLGKFALINRLINSLEQILGLPEDSAAPTDNSDVAIISLLKRLLSIKLPDTINGSIPTINYRPNVVSSPPVKSTLNIGDTITSRTGSAARTKILITNSGTNTVFVDVSPGVTTTSYGFILNPGDTMTDTFHTGLYYFRCASGLTTTVELREWQ